MRGEQTSQSMPTKGMSIVESKFSKKSRSKKVSHAGWLAPDYLAIIGFLVTYLFAEVFWQISRWVGVWYLSLSVVGFLLHAIDKSSAVAGRSRIRESTLILWSALGGWPGAILAQQMLHHKSKKVMFRLIFFVSVLVNFFIFIAFFSPLFQFENLIAK